MSNYNYPSHSGKSIRLRQIAGYMYRQSDRQLDRQCVRLQDRQSDRQLNRQSDRELDRQSKLIFINI